MSKINDKQKRQVIELRKRGLGYKRIANKIDGLNRYNVRDFIKTKWFAENHPELVKIDIAKAMEAPKKYGKTKCKYCGVEFIKNAGHQKYCGVDCRHSSNGGQNVRMVHVKDCKGCKSKFVTINGNKVYCSKGCYHDYQSRKRELKRKLVTSRRCEVCSGQLPKQKRKFCSDECFQLHRKEYYKKRRAEVKCHECGGHFLSNDKNQKFCSRACVGKSQAKRASNGKFTNQYGDLKERELKFKKRFESYYPDHRYISGYTGSDSYFKSKCLKCGEYQDRNAITVRPSRKHQALSCDGCMEIAREKKRRERLVQEEIWWIEKLLRNQKAREEEAERQRILSSAICTRCGKNHKAGRLDSVHCDECLVEIAEEEERLRKQWEGKSIDCHECGKSFEMLTSQSKYCSKECLGRATDRLSGLRRRKRLRKNGRIDKSITLTKLEQRYNGICAICGGRVDRNDCRYDERGNFIAGKKYPSTDHLIPVSRGGTHTWDNVQLAHHYCNTVKYNVISDEYQNKASNKQLTLI